MIWELQLSEVVEIVYVSQGPERIFKNSCEHLVWLEMRNMSEPMGGEEEESLTWAQLFFLVDD